MAKIALPGLQRAGPKWTGPWEARSLDSNGDSWAQGPNGPRWALMGPVLAWHGQAWLGLAYSQA